MKYILHSILFFILHFETNAALPHDRPRVKTNVNKISNEFNEHIQRKSELDASVTSELDKATASIGSGPMIEVLNPQKNPEGLEGLNPHSLEDMGQKKRDSKDMDYMNDFEIDYTRPGAMKHKKDADDIINATDDIFAKLSASMKDLELDCKEVEKNHKVDSPYYIEIEREEHKEVTYNQHFCEFPFNTYNCFDGATIHCEKPNAKCGEWKRESISVSGGELMSKTSGAFYFDKVARETFEMKLFSNHSSGCGPRGKGGIPYNSVPSMKGYFLQIHKPRDETFYIEIGDDMWFGMHDGISCVAGSSYDGRPLGGKDYVWNRYSITYFHRECERLCDKWSKERWDERCSQKH